ncbi:unnamed protein product, partial [Ixodes pacificus]
MHEGCREPTDGDSAEAMGQLASGCASSIRLGRLLGCRQDALALFVTLLTAPLSPGAGERRCFRRRKRRTNASWDCASQRMPGQLCGIATLAALSEFARREAGEKMPTDHGSFLLSVPPSRRLFCPSVAQPYVP